MDTSMETMLCNEIKTEFENLKSMELGSEEYKATLDGLTKLMDRAIELDNSEFEHQEKLKAMKDERISRWVDLGLKATGILLPAAITIWGVFATFEFEKEGTVTTIMGRGFIQKLLPKK